MRMNVQIDIEGEVAEAITLVNRRSLLKGALVVGASLQVLGIIGCGREAAGNIQSDSRGGNFLEPALLPIIAKLTDALLPSEGSGLLPADLDQIITNIDSLFGRFEPEVRSDLNNMLKVFNWSAVLLSGRFTRFEHLSKSQALVYLDDWQSGGVAKRAIVTVMKKFIYLSYWREPSTWSPILYDGPVSEKWGLPSLGNTPMPVETTLK